MSWRGVEGGIAAARSGHHAVMSPGDYCYLDFCQDDPTVEPPAAAAFPHAAYGLRVRPGARFAGRGGRADDPRRAGQPLVRARAHRGALRAYALAARRGHRRGVGWTQPEHKDYDDFYARVLVEIERMQERGYHPFEQKDAVGSRVESREPVACLSTGKAVTYNTAYSPKYAAAGDGTLTDGLRGGWNYGDKRWRGGSTPMSTWWSIWSANGR